MHEAFIITQYFLKKNESVEKIEHQENLLVIIIVRKTVRTFHKVAQLKMTVLTQFPSSIPIKLIPYKLTANTKRKLNETNEVIQQWLQQGFIVREIRYHQDGVSVREDHYRIGPAYIEVQQIEQQQLIAQGQQMKELQDKAQRLALLEIFQNVIEWDALSENGR